MIVDTHCHLHFPEFIEEHEQLINSMNSAGVVAAITVCTDFNEFEILCKLVDKYEQLYASIGVHPNTKASARCSSDELISLLANNPKFIAVGETGLDYFHDGRRSRTFQLPRFETQIEVALQTKLPLIIHTRDSIDDTLDILTEACQAGLRAVLHCFTGTWRQATRALDLGCMLSFTGIITFNNAHDLLDVAVRLPIERLMIETDAPYLAPVPMRGKRNEPAYVKHIAVHLAKARGISYEQFCSITTANSCEFFALNQIKQSTTDLHTPPTDLSKVRSV